MYGSVDSELIKGHFDNEETYVWDALNDGNEIISLKPGVSLSQLEDLVDNEDTDE